MKAILKSVCTGALALMLTASVALAQEREAFRQEELDQMLAPIALYPDPLLSQILMASTYPLEVVQAARWSRANPHLKGQDAMRAVEPMDWDPSVKSLVAFPQILHRMDERLDWTERLGEAFLAQEPQVMDTIQGLRRRAEAAGNLRSSDQLRVTQQGEAIYIEPPAPEVVYVPYYDPTVVYGPWGWPAYPPVYWGPPPGYYYAGPVYSPGFFWGSGIVISTGFFFGHCDWRHRHVTVVQNQVIVNRTTIVNQPVKRVVWEHNPVHRRGVPFRNPEARQRFERARITADAGLDSGRRDVVRSGRRVDDNRTAEFRQRRLEQRRNAGQPETRRMQPERNGRLERFAPQVDDRRSERRDVPRPQAQRPDSRPTVTAPATRPFTRPAVAAPTVQARARPDPRPAPPAANVSARPRQAFDGDRRAEGRNDGGRGRQHNAVRESAAPAPRPFVSGGSHAPRMGNGDQRGGGAQRQRSMAERIR